MGLKGFDEAFAQLDVSDRGSIPSSSTTQSLKTEERGNKPCVYDAKAAVLTAAADGLSVTWSFTPGSNAPEPNKSFSFRVKKRARHLR